MKRGIIESQDKSSRNTLYDQMEFNGNVERVFSLIRESSNPRIIIIETWLIIDYAIRQILIVGLNLQNYRSRYFKPLSDSFDRNLDLLFNVIQEQKQLLPKPVDYTLHFPQDFFMFCHQNYPNEFKTIQELQFKFYAWIMSQNLVVKQTDDISKFRCVENEWIEAIKSIDLSWKKAAKLLNKARNSAAHHFDSNELFKVFKLSGTEEAKLKLLKSECENLLRFLLGVKT